MSYEHPNLTGKQLIALFLTLVGLAVSWLDFSGHPGHRPRKTSPNVHHPAGHCWTFGAQRLDELPRDPALPR